MKFYKNKNYRYESEDRKFELTCDFPVKYYYEEFEVWIEGRIEHNGKDYYFYNNNGKNLNLSDGVMLEVLSN
ncbi:MAG: DUF5348 domain-containing protein [Clostridium paraputrificum]|uniref:DUF5348 domain-containing protein n=1 Tax=Clostridium TaxID=1485 RepID=UPI0029119AC1|nr:DUF5348 domain-containing protein [Clostridium sp.]MDU7215215.1 DUF5348 domain-containing protein [Clostridium sp.]